MQTELQTGPSGSADARPVTEQAKNLAEQVQEKATERVESGITKAKGQVAESLHALNQSLLISGQQLRDRNQQGVSRYVDNLADRVQRAADYLQKTDVSEIIDRTENFARRQPALFLGGAFALGLLGARFLKSSRRAARIDEWVAGSGSRGSYRERTSYAGYGVGAQPVQEWSAVRVEATGTGLADMPTGIPAGVPLQPLGESGLARPRDPLDYGNNG
jgi:hypothetical protein